MKVLEDFVQLIGGPLRSVADARLELLARRWDVVFPPDMVQILTAYGDSIVAGELTLFGPGTLERMSSYREGGLFPLGLDDANPRLAFPQPGGLLQWGMGSAGDIFSLRLDGQGDWVVSTYDQLAFEWIDYDLGFSDWLYSALSGESEFDILPPLGEKWPLSIIPLDLEKFLRW